MEPRTSSSLLRRTPGRFLRQAGLCFLLGAVFALGARAQEPAPTPPSSSSSLSSSSFVPTPVAVVPEHESPAGKYLAYRFVSGNRITYRVDYESTAHADFRALFQGQNNQQPAQSSSLVYALSAELHGQWVMTVLGSEDGRIRALYELHDGMARVVVNDQEQATEAEGVRSVLAQGVLVEMDPDGRVLAVHMNAAADKFARDFALSLFGVSEFLLPEASGGAWRSREEDRAGTYVASYRAVAEGNSKTRTAVIHKTKLRYSVEQTQSTLPGQTPAQKTIVPSGTLEARFDPATGQLISLSGTEMQDTIITEKNVARSAVTLHLTRDSSKRLAEQELMQLRSLAKTLTEQGARLALYTKISPQEMQASIQRTQLGSDTLETLLHQLGEVEKLDSGGKSDQTDLYLKFKALVYVHPESCARLGELLAAAGPQSPTFIILARALGSVGNAQAQDALVVAIKARPTDLVAVSNLIPTLAEAPTPTVKAEETIRQLANNSADANISATALLSLGTMAHGMAQRSPARSRGLVHDLLRQAAHPESEERTHDLVEALGNTQSAEALPAIATLARNGTPHARAAAWDALRFMPAPRADELLLSGLGDTDPASRLEAAYALGFRKINSSSFAAQKKGLLTDDNEKVRAALLANLWKGRAKFPGVRSLAENAASQDPSEYVRKIARGMLLENP